MEAYKETDIYKGLQANPHFENITATDFAVVENATRVTGGHAEAVGGANHAVSDQLSAVSQAG